MLVYYKFRYVLAYSYISKSDIFQPEYSDFSVKPVNTTRNPSHPLFIIIENMRWVIY